MLSFSFVSAAKFDCSPTPGGPLGGLSVGRGIPKGTELLSGAKPGGMGGDDGVTENIFNMIRGHE